MTNTVRTSLLLALVLTGCTSMRVSGNITDSVTGDIVNQCGITIGPKYVNPDGAGFYRVNARKWWRKMDVVCAGYEPQTVMVDSTKGRYPKVNIQMAPRRSTRTKVGPGTISKADSKRETDADSKVESTVEGDPDVVHQMRE